MASWRNCSSCKKDIAFEAKYWLCNVSTCTRKRTGLFFCSVGCWEAHLPSMRHRESWAVEERAPSESQWKTEQAAEAAEANPAAAASTATSTGSASGGRRVVAPSSAPARDGDRDDLPRDVLIVVSKLKKYVKARSGMNTSDNVMPVLSEHLRRVCDMAIRKAGEDGRRTLLDRDFRDLVR